MKADTACCGCIRAHEKSIAESLHVYIIRAIIVWVWGGCIFERNITTLENTPTPIFEKPHSLSMSVFLQYYSSRVTHDCISFSGLVTAVTDHWNTRHWYIFWTSVLCVEWCESPSKPSPTVTPCAPSMLASMQVSLHMTSSPLSMLHLSLPVYIYQWHFLSEGLASLIGHSR